MKKGQKTIILYYTKLFPLTSQLVQPTWSTRPLGETASSMWPLVFVVTVDAVPHFLSALPSTEQIISGVHNGKQV